MVVKVKNIKFSVIIYLFSLVMGNLCENVRVDKGVFVFLFDYMEMVVVLFMFGILMVKMISVVIV